MLAPSRSAHVVDDTHRFGEKYQAREDVTALLFRSGQPEFITAG